MAVSRKIMQPRDVKMFHFCKQRLKIWLSAPIPFSSPRREALALHLAELGLFRMQTNLYNSISKLERGLEHAKKVVAKGMQKVNIINYNEFTGTSAILYLLAKASDQLQDFHSAKNYLVNLSLALGTEKYFRNYSLLNENYSVICEDAANISSGMPDLYFKVPNSLGSKHGSSECTYHGARALSSIYHFNDDSNLFAKAQELLAPAIKGRLLHLKEVFEEMNTESELTVKLNKDGTLHFYIGGNFAEHTHLINNDDLIDYEDIFRRVNNMNYYLFKCEQSTQFKTLNEILFAPAMEAEFMPQRQNGKV